VPNAKTRVLRESITGPVSPKSQDTM
jgi:hypothetical protein